MAQLDQLVKPLDEMSDEELTARLREIRQRREVTRPAARKREERVETKASRGKVSKVEKLLAGLSPEDIEKLRSQLEESGDQGS